MRHILSLDQRVVVVTIEDTSRSMLITILVVEYFEQFLQSAICVGVVLIVTEN